MEADTILSIDIQNYYLDNATSIWALIICMIATALFSCLAALTQWGNDLGFNAAELLLYRSSIQLFFAILYTILFNIYSKCFCSNDNENGNDYNEHNNNNNEINNENNAINNVSKLSISSDDSLSAYSGYTRQTYGMFAIKQIFSSVNNTSLINYSNNESDQNINPLLTNVVETQQENALVQQLSQIPNNNGNECFKYNFYEWTLIFMRGLFGALNNASIIYSICLLDLGDAICLTCLSPIIVLIFIYIFFIEDNFVINNAMITLKFFISIILSFIGIILIIQPKFIGKLDNHTKADDTNGWIWGISGSVMSAAIYITLKKGKEKTIHIIGINQWFYSYCIISSILGIILSYSHLETLYGDINPTKHEYHVLLLILIGFLSFCAQFLYSISLQFLTPKYAIFSTQVLFIIFGYIWQIFAFNNIPKFITIIGASFIIIAIILIYMDFNYKILNIIKVKQNQLNKSKLINVDRRLINGKNKKKIKKNNKKKKKRKAKDSDSSGAARFSGNNPSMISTQTDSAITFNMDI